MYRTREGDDALARRHARRQKSVTKRAPPKRSGEEEEEENPLAESSLARSLAFSPSLTLILGRCFPSRIVSFLVLSPTRSVFLSVLFPFRRILDIPTEARGRARRGLSWCGVRLLMHYYSKPLVSL